MTKVKKIILEPQSNPAKTIETLCKTMWEIDNYRLASTFTVSNQLMLIFQKLDGGTSSEEDTTN